MPSGSRFKVASKREQNKFIYYVEREQLRRGQDDKVRLKEKGEIHPLRRYAPRPTCLRGTVCWRGVMGMLRVFTAMRVVIEIYWHASQKYAEVPGTKSFEVLHRQRFLNTQTLSLGHALRRLARC